MNEIAELRTFSDDLRGLEHSFSALAEAVEVVGYGLDFRSYILFKSVSPVTHQFMGGKISVEWMKKPTDDVDVVLRSINFVVEAAIQFGV